MNWYNTIDKSCLGENMKYIGLDIGGTKCAVSLGQDADTGFEVLERREFPTAGLSYQLFSNVFPMKLHVFYKQM